MAILEGTFTTKATGTVAVCVDHDGDDRAAALVELTLHLPGEASDADVFTTDSPRLVGDVVYDRDPGNACLETLVAPRRGMVRYTIIATVNGHEMHEHGVTGGETNMAWRTTLDERPVVTEPETPGVTHTQEIHRTLAPSGVEVVPTQTAPRVAETVGAHPN